MLPPGQGTSRALVASNQRRRLFAATIAAVSERGYDETSVADLVALSGVSRATFYRHFSDKRDCFEAALEEMLRLAVERIRDRCDGVAGKGKAEAAVEELIHLVTWQRAAARVCLVESYAAGNAARTALEAAVASFEELVAETLADDRGTEPMPDGIVRAIVGGFYKILHSRLYSGTEAELPGLAPALLVWMTGYCPPPHPLRAPRARLPAASPPPFSGRDRPERILRALAAEVAANGYAGTKVADVAARAGVSLSTFYLHFEGKRDALMAALDSSGAQMLAAAIPAARRAPSWPLAVRAALDSMCGFLAAEPDFAALRAVEVYAAGPEAMALRDRAVSDLFQALFALPCEDPPRPDPLVLEAIAGSIYGLLYRQLRGSGASAVPEIAPLLTYVSLAPLLGAERASEVANGPRR
ncbi:MAG TPA: TetR/AcrR family transcriptional regulator [Solirubrobacterales bacterium]